MFLMNLFAGTRSNAVEEIPAQPVLPKKGKKKSSRKKKKPTKLSKLDETTEENDPSDDDSADEDDADVVATTLAEIIIDQKVENPMTELANKLSAQLKVSFDEVIACVDHLWEHSLQYDDISLIEKYLAAKKNTGSFPIVQAKPAETSSEKKKVASKPVEASAGEKPLEKTAEPVNTAAKDGSLSQLQRLDIAAEYSSTSLFDSLSVLCQWAASVSAVGASDNNSTGEFQPDGLHLFFQSNALEILLATIIVDPTPILNNSNEAELFAQLLSFVLNSGGKKVGGLHVSTVISDILNSLKTVLHNLATLRTTGALGTGKLESRVECEMLAKSIAASIKDVYAHLHPVVVPLQQLSAAQQPGVQGPDAATVLLTQIKDLDRQVLAVEKDTNAAKISKLFALREFKEEKLTACLKRIQHLVSAPQPSSANGSLNGSQQSNNRSTDKVDLVFVETCIAKNTRQLEELLLSQNNLTTTPTNAKHQQTRTITSFIEKLNYERDVKIVQLNTDLNSYTNRINELSRQRERIVQQLALCDTEINNVATLRDAVKANIEVTNTFYAQQIEPLQQSKNVVQCSLEAQDQIRPFVDSVRLFNAKFAAAITQQAVGGGRQTSSNNSNKGNKGSATTAIPVGNTVALTSATDGLAPRCALMADSLRSYIESEYSCVDFLVTRILALRTTSTQLRKELQAFKNLSMKAVISETESKIAQLSSDEREDLQTVDMLQNNLAECLVQIAQALQSAGIAHQVPVPTDRIFALVCRVKDVDLRVSPSLATLTAAESEAHRRKPVVPTLVPVAPVVPTVGSSVGAATSSTSTPVDSSFLNGLSASASATNKTTAATTTKATTTGSSNKVSSTKLSGKDSKIAPVPKKTADIGKIIGSIGQPTVAPAPSATQKPVVTAPAKTFQKPVVAKKGFLEIQREQEAEEALRKRNKAATQINGLQQQPKDTVAGNGVAAEDAVSTGPMEQKAEIAVALPVTEKPSVTESQEPVTVKPAVEESVVETVEVVTVVSDEPAAENTVEKIVEESVVEVAESETAVEEPEVEEPSITQSELVAAADEEPEVVNAIESVVEETEPVATEPVAPEPMVEETVVEIEEPVIEEPVVEISEPVVEEPVVEEIVVEIEEPVVEEPVVEVSETVVEIEEPVVEEPVVEIEAPVVEEPVVEIEETVVEEPVVEEPVVEITEPVVEEPVVEISEPVVEEPVVEETVAEIEAPVVEEPVVEIEEPVVEIEETVVEEPVVEETVVEIAEPVVEEPVVEVPVVEITEPVVEITEPVVEVPAVVEVADVAVLAQESETEVVAPVVVSEKTETTTPAEAVSAAVSSSPVEGEDSDAEEEGDAAGGASGVAKKGKKKNPNKGKNKKKKAAAGSAGDAIAPEITW